MAKIIHKRRMGFHKRALYKATKGSEPFADVVKQCCVALQVPGDP